MFVFVKLIVNYKVGENGLINVFIIFFIIIE